MFSPAELIENNVNLFKAGASEKGISIAFSKKGDVPEWIIGDSSRLAQVIRNLMSNAVKFTSTGRIGVVVKSTKVTEKMVKLQVDVSDTGKGIDPDEADLLFKPFSQADISTSRIYGGSGLGLSICKKLMESMDGGISFDSIPGEGTTFTVFGKFSLGKPVLLPEDEYEEEEDTKTLAGQVLVVDDHDMNREVARLFLESMGVKVLEAENGQKALEVLRNQYPNLILMDVQMPEMDGFQATGLLRKEGFTLPVIAMTAHAMASFREECIQKGMNGVLSKPFTIEQLRNILEKWLIIRKV